MAKKGYCYGTIEYTSIILKHAFKIALKDHLISENPISAAMEDLREDLDTKKERRHALTASQQTRFITFCNSPANKEYEQWLPLLTLLFATGMRIGEAVSLTWSDINLEHKTIHVKHTAYFGKETRILPPKTAAGDRIIPILPGLEKILLAERERQHLLGIKSCTIDGHTDFVFLNHKGCIITTTKFNYALEVMRRRCNEDELRAAERENREPVLIPHFSAHTIRHSFASRAVEENTISPKLLQELMGHSTITMTMDGYAEISEEKKVSLTIEGLSGRLKFM